MSAGKPEPLVIHGWTVFAHPLFLAQIEALARQVEAAVPILMLPEVSSSR